MRYLIVLLALCCALTVWPKTAAQFLAEAPAPVFQARHTLLPLTHCGWPLQVPLQAELSSRWGYALEIDPGPLGENVGNPLCDDGKLLAYAKAHPTVPVSIYTRRILQYPAQSIPLLPETAWCHDALGARLEYAAGYPRLKPFLTDDIRAKLAASEVPRVQALLAAGVTPSVVLNAAEYEMTVAGNNGGLWRKDPTVNTWLNSFTALADPLGREKGAEEQAIRDAILAKLPNAALVYYTTGDPLRGYVSEENRSTWTWPYRYMINAGTVPSWQVYANADLTGGITALTNCAAQGIADGKPLAYNWVCGGWSTTAAKNLSDTEYMGLLKILYTLGAVGQNAGYYRYPTQTEDGYWGFNADMPVTVAPWWLRQIMILSHCHALFSHLESYLREGDLLDGDLGQHKWAVDIYGKPQWAHPAYEFKTGVPNTFVLARKKRAADAWLLCAWSTDLVAHPVTVKLPALGNLTLSARPEGSVYVSDGTGLPVLLDAAGMDPTARWR